MIVYRYIIILLHTNVMTKEKKVIEKTLKVKRIHSFKKKEKGA